MNAAAQRKLPQERANDSRSATHLAFCFYSFFSPLSLSNRARGKRRGSPRFPNPSFPFHLWCFAELKNCFRSHDPLRLRFAAIFWICTGVAQLSTCFVPFGAGSRGSFFSVLEDGVSFGGGPPETCAGRFTMNALLFQL